MIDRTKVEEIIPDWAQQNKAARFFFLYTKFEYALKRAGGYLTKDAAADWLEFAKKIDAGFFKKISSGKGIYLIKKPPRTQINKDGQLAWAPVDDPPTLRSSIEILKAVKTVRNNLFHGGKYPHVPIDEPSRDGDLMDACAQIIIEALKIDEKVEAAFLEPPH